ncbi:MAG: FGGY family carbohydrate kinase, partial [Acidobacteriota bacterium]|nr:FGGY family carbohydrate kinase [Acidobacteriota bacterium]
MLAAVEMSKNLLPELYESNEITGTISAECAAETGLKIGTPIVAGAGDNAAGAIGMGIVKVGAVSATIGTSGMKHFDAHAYRTEDYDGVKDFARGCMRSYLILKDKAKRWNENAEIKSILADIEATNKSYEIKDIDALLSENFDRHALASKGLQYEKLDQLTMDILFGVD